MCGFGGGAWWGGLHRDEYRKVEENLLCNLKMEE